jgi:hypothetical protein
LQFASFEIFAQCDLRSTGWADMESETWSQVKKSKILKFEIKAILKIEVSLHQGCQIFLDTIYKNEWKLPNYHNITKWPKIYQMSVKFSEWP